MNGLLILKIALAMLVVIADVLVAPFLLYPPIDRETIYRSSNLGSTYYDHNIIYLLDELHGQFEKQYPSLEVGTYYGASQIITYDNGTAAYLQFFGIVLIGLQFKFSSMGFSWVLLLNAVAFSIIAYPTAILLSKGESHYNRQREKILFYGNTQRYYFKSVVDSLNERK